MARKAALVLLAFAFALAGCGGGDDDGTSTQSSAAQGEAPAGERSAGEAKSAKGNGEKADGNEQGSAENEGSEPNTAPLEVSGGGSAQFKVKGGDNSVQDYGEEADEGELRDAAELVHSFYLARVAGEMEEACSYLAAEEIEGLEELAARSPQLKGKGCAVVLDALTEDLSPTLQRQATMVDAAALREEGEQGFLIYTGPPGQTVYSMPLNLEDGVWKLGAISASVLPGT